MPSVPPRPENEEARLERLRQYRILDSDPSEAFDRISRLASRLLNAPIALVTFIDAERQWFKSTIGMDAVESPRDFAFCAHTICGPELLVVPDAQEDRRFADNPYVTDAPFVRFYAGVPLCSPDGFNVGTLCVVDQVPREFSPEDQQLLLDLGKIVLDEMDLHALVSREQEAHNRLIDAIEAAPDGFIYFDSEDRLELCNSRFRALFPDSSELLTPGATFEEMLREAVRRGQFPEAKGCEEAWIQERLDLHRNPTRTVEQKLANGRWVRIEERRTRDGGTVGFRTDITELKERELALEKMAQREQEARNRLYDAIEAVPDGFVYYDSEDCLELCNERYREFYPESADLMIPGAPFEWIIRQGVARGQYVDAIGNEEAWIKQRLEIHNNPQGPIEQQLPNGRWLRIEERRTRDGGMVGFRTDITELKEREFELERLATTDPLTGAMNRRSFLEAGEKELRRGLRYDVPLSVLLLDVDHFKQINDTYGHAAGDEVLRNLVKVAWHELREHDLLCRYGGEEFSVVLPETDRAGAEVAAQRLLTAFENARTPTEQGDVRATVSIGGTQVDVHNDSLESALSRADAALYEAKESGRNRAVFKYSARPRLKAAL